MKAVYPRLYLSVETKKDYLKQSQELGAQAAVLLRRSRIAPVSNVTRIINLITRIILISFLGETTDLNRLCR